MLRASPRFLCLEIITPIRGRKVGVSAVDWFPGCLEIITPIRGRKDMLLVSTYYHLTFRNNNPDKGTETLYRHGIYICFYLCLEIITPIRGWKLEYYEGDNSNEQNK